MSAPSNQPSEPDAGGVEQTVVVGYPDVLAARSAAASGETIQGLRQQIRTLRLLLVACLTLLVLIACALGAAVSSGMTRLDGLSDEVSALAASASVPESTPEAQAAPQEVAVKQLGPAPELQGIATLPSGADATGAILVGDPNATDVVEVYVDYQCPYCQRWEQGIGAALFARALQPGSGLLIKQYDLAFLGETNANLDPPGASARAASAAACVVDADGPQVFVAFTQAVYAAADPSEPPGQFTDDVLVSLATQAGASPESLACIRDEAHVPFVAATTRAGFERGVGGTPTVVLNGQTIGNPFTDQSLASVATVA
jgi:protein-disulfide isomerase